MIHSHVEVLLMVSIFSVWRLEHHLQRHQTSFCLSICSAPSCRSTEI